jgi:type IX secretion system PorP/SprF family membrane protein
MKHVFLLPALFLIVCTKKVTSQDIHFAQLTETPLLLNPALTGLYDGFYRGILNYRNQWPGMGKPYSTFMASFDMPWELKMKKNSEGILGIGAYLYSDKAGDSQFGTTEGNLSLAAIVPIDKMQKFSAGLQFGFAQHSADLTAIQWPNQYNGMQYDPSIAPNENFNSQSFSYFDMGAGVNYQFNTSAGTIEGKDITRFDIGAAFFHPTQPTQKHYSSSTEKLYGRIIVNASLRYDFPGTLMGIVPSAIYMSQGPASEINIGLLCRYKINQGTKVTGFYSESAILFGMHYRFKDAVSPQILFELSDFGFGFSYDINISSYGDNNKKTGAFEVSLKYANMKGAVRKGMK